MGKNRGSKRSSHKKRSGSISNLQETISNEGSTSQSSHGSTQECAHKLGDIITESITHKIGVIRDACTHTPPLEDIITTDDILCTILSFVTLREAVRTSVLSPRWRNTWTNLPNLKFDAGNVLDARTVSLAVLDGSPLTEDQKVEVFIEKSDHFVRSVDSVLQQHQGRARVHEFFLQYFLHKGHSKHLDACVGFVVSSKVKALCLNLHEPFAREFEDPQKKKKEVDHYDFPCHLLGSSSPLEELTLSCCSLEPPSDFKGLRCLKSLSLFYVHVTNEDINRLLSNCYTLQNLSIKCSDNLVELSFPHPLSQLRILTVRNCMKLTKIEIKAINLRQLNYWGYPVDFIFPQSSRLSFARIGFITEYDEPDLDFYLSKVSSNLPHLRVLEFRILGSYMVPVLPKRISCFNFLTQLDWRWNTDCKMTILHLTTLLDATPFLELLQLQFMTLNLGEQPPQSLKRLRKMLSERPHANLKTIIMCNYCWYKWQIEIALYLFKNAIELKAMMIYHVKDPEILKKFREMDIENLRKEVPLNVEFVIV